MLAQGTKDLCQCVSCSRLMQLPAANTANSSYSGSSVWLYKFTFFFWNQKSQRANIEFTNFTGFMRLLQFHSYGRGVEINTWEHYLVTPMSGVMGTDIPIRIIGIDAWYCRLEFQNLDLKWSPCAKYDLSKKKMLKFKVINPSLDDGHEESVVRQDLDFLEIFLRSLGQHTLGCIPSCWNKMKKLRLANFKFNFERQSFPKIFV